MSKKTFPKIVFVYKNEDIPTLLMVSERLEDCLTRKKTQIASYELKLVENLCLDDLD
jgi:hypothetical protein